jgi:hypothetical protein
MTRKDAILEAAQTLAQPFAIEDLILAVWAKNKREWGLGKYWDSHPNTKRVECEIHGVKGLVSQGYLDKVSPGIYRVNEEWQSEMRITAIKLAQCRAALSRRKNEIAAEAEARRHVNPDKVCRHGLRQMECYTCLQQMKETNHAIRSSPGKN